MPRCRICDDEHEHDELSEDDCCIKCVNASEDLFDEDNEFVPVSDDDAEELGWYDDE